jgi:hypothetical protein
MTWTRLSARTGRDDRVDMPHGLAADLNCDPHESLRVYCTDG